ncbi:MAG: type II toxin-antitoxin system RelE/ParE family toxin [Gemmataceae bacterium]|nr:type II toxin-antitoxin system RelE/ParE family toxin [Gemmataceae bacterium]
MRLPLILTLEAEADIAEAKAWYEKQRKGLQERFVLALETVFTHIARFPEASSEAHAGVRRTVVQRFTYAVYYCVDSHIVAVIAVYRSDRDPKRLEQRF